MKIQIGSLLFALTLLMSCAAESDTFEIDPSLPQIALVNWTGHWDAICSPGQTLIFNITHKEKTERFEIAADSGASFRKDMTPGDILRITIQDIDRNVLHSRTKEYLPIDKEPDQFGIVNPPVIRVCQIDRLDIDGF